MSHESEQLVATAFHHMRAARKREKHDPAVQKVYEAFVKRAREANPKE